MSVPDRLLHQATSLSYLRAMQDIGASTAPFEKNSFVCVRRRYGRTSPWSREGAPAAMCKPLLRAYDDASQFGIDGGQVVAAFFKRPQDKSGMFRRGFIDTL